jgi:dipeptidyl aminopeptidase/acylaminoacyl peptidase
MPDQLAVWQARTGEWSVVSGAWDHDVHAPLCWSADGRAVAFTAEERGRTHLWRFELASRQAQVIARGGSVQGFDLRGDTWVTVTDAMDHPAQACVHRGDGHPERIETFNDTLTAELAPGRYAAYVCHAGCFDWTAMFADDAYTWHAKELGAWYWDDLAKVQSQSPHASAAAMATPTLVIHGALDYRVPDAQGLAYYNTLKARGVPARLLWFPDANLWVLKPRNSRLWYREFFDWLQRFGSASSGHRSKKNSRPPHAEEQRSVQPLEGRKTAAPRRPARSSPRSR